MSKEAQCPYSDLTHRSKNLMNKSFVNKAIMEGYGEILCFASDNLLDNYHLISSAVKLDGNLISYASNRLKNNKRIALMAIKTSEHAYLHLSDRLRKEQSFCFRLLSINPFVFDLLPNEFRLSRRFITRAARILPPILIDAPEEFVNCSRTMRRLVKLNVNCMKYIGKNLKEDQIYIDSLRKSNQVFVNTSKDALAAIRSKSLSLRNCSTKIRANKDIVFKVMNYNKYEIRYADQSLIGDRNFIQRACKIYEHSFAYASNDIKKDKAFITILMKMHPSILQYADVEIKNCKDLALQMVMSDGLLIRTLPHNLKLDQGIALAAIKSEPLALKFMPFHGKSKEILSKVANSNPFALVYNRFERHNFFGKGKNIPEFFIDILIHALPKIKKRLSQKDMLQWYKLYLDEYSLKNTLIFKYDIFPIMQNCLRSSLSLIDNSRRFALKALNYDPVFWSEFFSNTTKNDPLLVSLYLKKREALSDREIEDLPSWSFFSEPELKTILRAFYSYGRLGKSMLGQSLFSKITSKFKEELIQKGSLEPIEEFNAFLQGRYISSRLKRKVQDILFNSNKDYLNDFKYEDTLDKYEQ